MAEDLSNKFADAIRRIVEPILPNTTEDTSVQDKASISGSRGIGYNGSTGTTGTGGTPGVTQAPAAISPFIKASTDALQSAAVSAALNALGAFGSGQGSFDAGALLAAKLALKSNDALLQGAITGAEYTTNGSEKVLELTGLKDCDTNTPIRVRTDGFFTPPTGWDDAESPPIDPDYHEGFYWTLTTGFTGLFSNYFDGLVALRAAVDGTTAYGVSGGFVISKPPNSGETIQFGAAGHGIGDPTGPIGGTVYNYTASGTVGLGEYGMEACASGDPGSETACSADPPVAQYWPTSGEGKITRDVNGQFVTSQYDSEIPSAFTETRSKLSLCTTDDTPVEITALKNGGWAFYETSAGTPTGVIQIYNKDNSIEGYTDLAGLQNLLPS